MHSDSVLKYKLVVKVLMITFWVLGTYNFIFQETVPSVLDKISIYVSILSELIIVLLGLWTLRSKADKALIVSFLVLAIISNRVNNGSLILLFNGLRHYIPMMFLLPIVRYLFGTRERATYFIGVMDKSLYIFLWLQVPAMVYQCALYGAFDNVGGTLGWMCSGMISCLIYVISFYLMICRWDFDKNYLENLRNNWILIVLLLPSYLNETKISFIYLIMYFFFLVPMDRKFLLKALAVLPIVVAAVAGAGYLYMTFVNTEGEDPFTGDFIEQYTLGNDFMNELVIEGYMNKVMPDVQETDFARGIKFRVTPILLSDNPHGWLLGYGVGQFKGGSHVEQTEFAKNYSWFLQGTNMFAMMMIIELGIPGCIWLLAYFFVLFRWFYRVKSRNNRLQWFMGLTVLSVLAYGPNFIYIAFMLPMLYIIFMSSRWRLNSLVAPLPLSLSEILNHEHRLLRSKRRLSEKAISENIEKEGRS